MRRLTEAAEFISSKFVGVVDIIKIFKDIILDKKSIGYIYIN